MEFKRWDTLAGKQAWFHLARIQFHRLRTSCFHTHDFPEVFWVEAGEAEHEINGFRKKLSSGGLVFVRPSDRHRLGAVDERGFVLVNLAFPAGPLAAMRKRHPEMAAADAPSSMLPARHRLTGLQMRRLREETAWLAEHPSSRVALECFLLRVCLLVSPKDQAVTEALPDWLAKGRRALERPEVFTVGVPAFVRVCGRSAEYVARSTHRHFGKTPTELVNTARLAHAARELRLGTRPILDVAMDCGIGNLSHFYRLFRQAHNTTPRRYRAEQQRIAA